MKELTPEEKKQYGITSENELGLTPEQIAANEKNQQAIQQGSETEEETLEISEQENQAAADTAMEIEEEPVEEALDLDAMLDDVEHTFEDSVNTPDAPMPTEPTDTLESTIAQVEQQDPEKKPYYEQAAHNKEILAEQTASDASSHIRTFHKEVAALRSTGDVAVGSQMLREAHQEERAKKEEVEDKSQIKIFTTLSAIFILVAAGIVIYMTQFNKPSTVGLEPTNIIPSLLPADIQIPIDVTGAYHFKVKQTVAEKVTEQTEFKQLAHFYFGEATRTGGKLLSTSEFFSAINVRVPLSLSPILGNQFMFGTYTVQDPVPFLVLPVSSFPKARDAMLAWESNMLRDFKDIFALSEQHIQPEAFDYVFQDTIIANQHVRLLYTPVIETIEETFILQDQLPNEEVTEENEEVTATQESEDLVENNNEQEVTESTDILEEVNEAEQDTVDQTELETFDTDEIIEQQENIITQTFTQTERIISGSDLALLYTFINENTILITTDPSIIPEIIKRYSNRQIFLQ